MTEADLAAAIAAEAAAHPQGGLVPLLPDLTLLVDGDGLAYSAAGNDSTPPGMARQNLIARVAQAQAKTGAGAVKILTTAPGSPKGERFAVARSKPYQGQRKGSARPKNWGVLRDMLETGAVPKAQVELTWNAEADDLFGYYSEELGAENVVIHTEDKDMRMVPGHHLTWDTMEQVFVPKGTWAQQFNGKTYGRSWFWQQMLSGDAADNIPGLPGWHQIGTKRTRLGPVTAAEVIGGVDNQVEAAARVAQLYHAHYGEDTYRVEMLEQAILLWIRTDKYSSPWDVLQWGNPFEGIPDMKGSIEVIRQRIVEARKYRA